MAVVDMPDPYNDEDPYDPEVQRRRREQQESAQSAMNNPVPDPPPAPPLFPAPSAPTPSAAPPSAPRMAPPPDGQNTPGGGGYLDGIGETIRPGSSITRGQADEYRRNAIASGIPEAWVDDFISRNDGDFNRIVEAYTIPTSHRPYDSQSGNPNEQAANRTADQSAPTWLRNAIAASQSGQLARNTFSGAGPAPQASRNSFNFSAPPFQFDDPYTKRLEDIVNQQLTALEQPQTNPALDQLLGTINQQFGKFSDRVNTPQSNPALDQLLSFLGSRFNELSGSPGMSPEDLAILRTQMLEPIERDRAANRDRVTARTASRGMLPSSGLHEQDLQEFVDRPAMEARTGAQRDIAIHAMGQRRQDLGEAVNVGKMAGVDIPQMQRTNEQQDLSTLLNLGQIGGIQVPGLMRAEDQARRAESLQLASLLYDLPGRALAENMSVINGTPGPESLFNQAMQLQQVQTQNQALNANRWAQIGQLLAGLEF